METVQNGLRIGILGGGIAGLGCALALQRAGIKHVRVFEKAAALDLPERQGHGLILMQNGIHALHALGIAPLLDHSTPLDEAIFQNQQGHIFQEDQLEDIYCVSRTAIIDSLLNALPAETVLYNYATKRIDLDAHKDAIRTIQFNTTEILHRDQVDLFIDATGYRSPLCQVLNFDCERPSSRVKEIVTSSTLPNMASQLGTRFIKTIFAERGVAFGLLAPTAERVIGFLQFDSFRYTPPTRQTNLRHFLQDMLIDAPELVTTYLKKADLTTAHVWHPVDADLPARWHNQNAIAIGDAAHPLLPFTSQGVSAALEDGIMLADALQALAGDVTELPQILAAFSQKRRRDMQPFVAGGRRILQQFVNDSDDFVLPYIDGVESALEEHLLKVEG